MCSCLAARIHPHVMVTEALLLCLQRTSIGQRPSPDKTSIVLRLSSLIPLLMLSTFLLLCLLSIFFPSYFATQVFEAFLSVHESCCIYDPKSHLSRVP